jgi:hypothetical protein
MRDYGATSPAINSTRTHPHAQRAGGGVVVAFKSLSTNFFAERKVKIMKRVLRHPVVTIVTLSVFGGFVGFVGGIAWCLHDYPGSPQAPLFGMFITGPLGFFLGLSASVVLFIIARRVCKHDKKDAA